MPSVRRGCRSDGSSSDSHSDSDRRRSKRLQYSDPDSDPSKRKRRKFTDDELIEYLAKKAQKKAMKVAKKLKLQSGDLSGYSNDSNPFGDANLNEKFVWKKKIEKDVSQGVPLDDFSLKAEKMRQIERKAEIEKVKKRREEREIEKAQRVEEMALQARDPARADDWEKKEKDFLLDQSKVRSEIRSREGRLKPIDILIKLLDPSDDFEIKINEPYTVFKGLTVKEMEELHNEIKIRHDLDRAIPTHIRYWEALLVVSEWGLAEARKKDALDRAPEMIGEERGLHMSIEADVKSLLQRKTYSELEALQSKIESQMQSGIAKVVEYWEAILKRLPIYKAKACLKEIHANMPLRKHLQTEPAQEVDEHKCDQDVVATGAMEEGDVVFGSASSDENNLDSQVFWWHDKYRLRKPKYVIRERRGYEWNRYNRTHYDHDNPPPKTVLGYKFDIFYPDLVDKQKIPTCTTLERDRGTRIIRFHAGPPYEDIAFQIVSEEWETSPKKGYKSTFDRGILRLYFNFKRCGGYHR